MNNNDLNLDSLVPDYDDQAPTEKKNTKKKRKHRIECFSLKPKNYYMLRSFYDKEGILDILIQEMDLKQKHKTHLEHVLCNILASNFSKRKKIAFKEQDQEQDFLDFLKTLKKKEWIIPEKTYTNQWKNHLIFKASQGFQDLIETTKLYISKNN